MVMAGLESRAARFDLGVSDGTPRLDDRISGYWEAPKIV